MPDTPPRDGGGYASRANRDLRTKKKVRKTKSKARVNNSLRMVK